MRIHLIAIGGSAMHNLAMALHQKGYQVSGSDDEIFEPSKSRLDEAGLLPTQMGWDASRINSDLDVVILGMHAKKDNPELLRAQELGLKLVSYPEFIYEQSKDKKRIVVGGSHGKTSITAMILHVLQKLDIETDYLVGAQLEGFHTMVKLSDAPLMVIEGDEYLSSPIDRRPKFLWYKPHIATISGIAWDHINVFPTFEEYCEQFGLFIESIQENGSLIYYQEDKEIKALLNNAKESVMMLPYKEHDYRIEDGISILVDDDNEYPLLIFGEHNLQNLNAAFHACMSLGISKEDFYESITSFKGAARRMELIAENAGSRVYKDFAHAPSKLKATCEAVRKQFPNKKIIACVELHTFSSLNKEFLSEYSGSMNDADEAIVYFNPHTIEHKGLESISKEEVENAFSPSQIAVYNDSGLLTDHLRNQALDNSIVLLMTSGNFDGVSLNEFGEELLGS